MTLEPTPPPAPPLEFAAREAGDEEGRHVPRPHNQVRVSGPVIALWKSGPALPVLRAH